MAISRRFFVTLGCLAACGDGSVPPPTPVGEDAAIEAPACMADTRNDPSNCGGCGRVCATEQRCADGLCVAREPLDTYAGCRGSTGPDLRCDNGRRCVSVGSGGPRVCSTPCLLSEVVCPTAPSGSDARSVCVRNVFYCMLACTAATQCPAGLACRFLPPGGTDGYCAP